MSANAAPATPVESFLKTMSAERYAESFRRQEMDAIENMDGQVTSPNPDQAAKRSQMSAEPASDKDEVEQLQRVFEKLATGEGGTAMVAEEFIHAVQTLYPPATLQMAAEAFAGVDDDQTGSVNFEAFCKGYQAVKAMPKPSAPRNGDEVALPANRAKGKSFTGSKGGGRYTNVPDAPEGDGPSSPMPNSPGPAAREGHKIQLDMWEDGRFEYRYEQNKDAHPDGPEVLKLFLLQHFGTKEQKAFRGDDIVQRIETQLAQGGITTMKAVRGSNKRQLDELGLSVGVRAVLVDKSPTWTPPSWDDPSFFMEGAALPRIVVASHIQVSFVANFERMAAYDNVQVPSYASFALDGAFMASGQCRGLNGHCPGPDEQQRAFLAYTTDMIEEAEVESVRKQKEKIRTILGGKLHEMAVNAEWVLREYHTSTQPLLEEGGCYVGQEAVQRSADKLQSLKSAVDQALATFEDYYGESEKLASLPTMEEMVAQEEAEAKAAKAKEEEKLMFQKMMSGAMITDSTTAGQGKAVNPFNKLAQANSGK